MSARIRLPLHKPSAQRSHLIKTEALAFVIMPSYILVASRCPSEPCHSRRKKWPCLDTNKISRGHEVQRPGHWLTFLADDFEHVRSHLPDGYLRAGSNYRPKGTRAPYLVSGKNVTVTCCTARQYDEMLMHLRKRLCGVGDKMIVLEGRLLI